MQPLTYTCANCGQTFARARTDAEVAFEFAAEFPSFQEAATVTVCDHCYREFMAWIDETGQLR